MSKKSLSNFENVSLFKRDKFDSDLGFFTNTYDANMRSENFIQDSCSFIKNKGTVKGMHFQDHPFEQAKLVTVIKGEIFDFIVDLRPSSKTFLDYAKVIISEENRNILFIPRGFAHGYITTSKNTLISYKIDNIYSPNHQQSIYWQDKNLGIGWPKYKKYFLSTKDRNAKNLSELNIV